MSIQSSKEVQKALIELQSELEKLQPAVQHIGAAKAATKAAAEISTLQEKAIQEILDSDRKHKLELQGILKKEVRDIGSELDHVIKKAKEIQGAVSANMASVQSALSNLDSISGALKDDNFYTRFESLEEAGKAVSGQIEVFGGELQNKHKDIKDSVLEINQSLIELYKLLVKVQDETKNETGKLLDSLKKVSNEFEKIQKNIRDSLESNSEKIDNIETNGIKLQKSISKLSSDFNQSLDGLKAELASQNHSVSEANTLLSEIKPLLIGLRNEINADNKKSQNKLESILLTAEATKDMLRKQAEANEQNWNEQYTRNQKTEDALSLVKIIMFINILLTAIILWKKFSF